MKSDSIVFKIYKAYTGLFLTIIPSLVIVCLSISIVIGFKSLIGERSSRLSQSRVSTMTIKRDRKSRRHQLIQTITVLVVNASYNVVIMTIKRDRKSRRQQLIQTITVLVVNASYGICSVPYAVLAALYETKVGHCTSNASVETSLLLP